MTDDLDTTEPAFPKNDPVPEGGVPLPPQTPKGEPMTTNTTAIRVIFAVASAVCSFLLIQEQIQAYPIVLLALGALNAGLAAASPFLGSSNEGDA